jgi:hypothetical protein
MVYFIHSVLQNKTEKKTKECEKQNSHISSKLHLIYIIIIIIIIIYLVS